MEGEVVDDLDSPEALQRETATSPPGPATARRRLMLGAVGVLPSVVTLQSGAQTAATSSLRCWAKDLSTDPPDRYTLVPDGWLRKKVYLGKYQGKPAICTMWEQAACVDDGKEHKGAEGSTWVTNSERVIVGRQGSGIEHISHSPEVLALVYVDHTGSKFALEPDEDNKLRPVRETCWTSMIGDKGTQLG